MKKEKKLYRLIYERITTLETEVEAYSEQEAEDLADKVDDDDMSEQVGYRDLVDVDEISKEDSNLILERNKK